MIKRKYLMTFFCTCYVFFYIFGQATGKIELITASLIVGYIGFFIGIDITKKMMFFIFSFLIVIFSALLINHTYPLWRLIFNSFFLFINLFFAYFSYKKKMNVVFITRLLIIGILFYFLYCFIMAHVNSEAVYIFMEHQLVGFSYNYISGLLILCSAMLFATEKLSGDLNNKKNICFTVIILIVCFVLYGRSGIIFSFIIFLISILNALRKKGYAKYLVINFFICILIFIFMNFHKDISTLVMESKFKEGISSPRSIMLTDYFNQIDIYTLFTGVDLNKIPLIVSFNYNPHNSFLNLHAMYGIFAIFFIIIMFFFVCLIFTKDFIVGFLLLVYLGRGMFDTIIFPSVTDFIFFYILMRFFIHTKTGIIK
ncbi:hypothetical protein ACGVWS_00155 [Enterobacteriaceae bacterium LUAb1]